MANSDCFFGKYAKGKKEGMGLYLYGKGGYYFGNFKNNEKIGMGVLYNKNYDYYYLGEFKGDLKNGVGREM